MPLTPTDVANKQFRIALRGYSLDEVDAFLDEVENELARLLRENAALQERGGGAAAAAPAPAAAAAPAAQGGQMEGQEAALRTLLLAQRTADEAIAEARAEAEQMLSSARAEAESTLASARAEAERTLTEAQNKAARIDQDVAARISAATGDLDARRRALEGRIEELRSFEREYRTRLKAYLENQLRDLQSGAGPDDGGVGVPAGARTAAVAGSGQGSGQGRGPGAQGAEPAQGSAQDQGSGPGGQPGGQPAHGDQDAGAADRPPREADAPSGLRAVPPLSASSAPVGPFTVVPAEQSGERGPEGQADR